MKQAQKISNNKWPVSIFMLVGFFFLTSCNIPTSGSDVEKDTVVVIEKESEKPIDNKSDNPSTPATPDTVSATPDEEQSPKDDFLIVPGKSMGKISLGMSQEKALEILGKPDATNAGAGTVVYTWKGKTKPYKSEVNVVTGYAGTDMKKRVVKLIRTTSMYFHTKEGASAEKDLAEVKKLFRGLSFVKTYQSANHQVKTDLYASKSKGIVFECLNYDKKICVGVQVLSPSSEIPLMEF